MGSSYRQAMLGQHLQHGSRLAYSYVAAACCACAVHPLVLSGLCSLLCVRCVYLRWVV